MSNIDELIAQACVNIENASDLAELRDIQVSYLGKKGKISDLLKSLGKMPADQRKSAGVLINQGKETVAAAIQQKQHILAESLLQKKIAAETVDISLPGRRQSQLGSLHPITLTLRRIQHFFSQMGFAYVEGEEIEDEYHNFSALNIPPHHPARAMHDTFYIDKKHLLRTHTSPQQIRYMQDNEPPLRMIACGRVYRCDSDVTHTPMFHQAEGFLVDSKTSMAELKGILQSFIRYFFEIDDLPIRFRASYFPFTEPSAEVDMKCVNCGGKGCKVCRYSGWLEILGCGMAHPEVLKAGNIDPEKYQGFAFGIGIDRIAMLRYQIDDLRILFENDLRFLQQF